MIGQGFVSGSAIDKSGLVGVICQEGIPANCVSKAILGGFGSDVTYTAGSALAVMITIGVRYVVGSLRSRRQISTPFMPGKSMSKSINARGFARSSAASNPSSAVSVVRVGNPAFSKTVAKYFRNIRFVFDDQYSSWHRDLEPLRITSQTEQLPRE